MFIRQNVLVKVQLNDIYRSVKKNTYHLDCKSVREKEKQYDRKCNK